MTEDTGRPPLEAAIVVGVDGSTASANAVRWAADVAAHRRRPLHIVHGAGIDTYANAYVTVPGVPESLRDHGRSMLTSAVRIARASGVETVTTELADGLPAALLIEMSRTARMVVIGAPPVHALPRLAMGSIATQVAAHAAGNLVVVHGDPETWTHTGPVVVGVDGGPTSDEALAAAFEEASLRSAPLVALHVWSDRALTAIMTRPGYTFDKSEYASIENAIFSERLAGWQEKYPDVSVTRETQMSGAIDHLIAHSHRAQLVVVGSRGRGGFKGLLLGSTSSALVRHAGCPILIAHPRPHPDQQ